MRRTLTISCHWHLDNGYVCVTVCVKLSKLYVILPQEVDQPPLPGDGCLYTIGKLNGIFSLLLAKIGKIINNTCKPELGGSLFMLIHDISPLYTWGGGTTRCKRWPSCSSYATGSWPFQTCCYSRRHLQNGDHTAGVRYGRMISQYTN